MITQEKLKEQLDYDHDTGIFYRKVSNSSRIKIGSITGTLDNNGYVHIMVCSKIYKAHRLVWLYVYGENPKYFIDHINGIRNDNRISNLREATRSDNGMNRGKNSNNTSGYKGVSWHKQANKWQVDISVNRKTIYFGLFDNIEDAILTHKNASIKYHGEFSNVDNI